MSDAILLVNLGTPDAPTAPALRRYLAEFLGDRRVVDLPRLLWWPILHGIILNTRPARSAAKYARIWTREGSPLKFHTEKQARLVSGLIGHRGIRDVAVAWAMRYGQPSIHAVLDRLKRDGARRIVVVPLYPQFSASTTLSTRDAVRAWREKSGAGIKVVEVEEFHQDAGYIAALRQSVLDHWTNSGRPDHLLMSFHGIPKRAVERGDPYESQCRRTAELLAVELNLPTDRWQITFQSRFGAAEWLQPYTLPTLEQLGRAGVKSVDVMCPGFPADCLETLEEINMECRETFLAAGGGEFRYVPCLNERPDWIAALTDLALDRLAPAT
jgi:ferrochelatase